MSYHNILKAMWTDGPDYINSPSNNYERITRSSFKPGDMVRNINSSCKHYGSEGIVKEILDLGIRVEGQSKGFLEDVGYAVVYECTNQGMTWKKGDLLGKTEVQLKKIN